MIKPAVKTTLYEEISNQIIDVIKSGKWIQGDKIPGEIELSQLFEVSRNCIREAIKALELAGILESKPGKGTFVTNDAITNISRMELLSLLKNSHSSVELMETRLAIEPHLAYYAAKRANDEDINKLEKVLNDALKSITSDKYTPEIGFQFHMTIAEIANNSILYKFLYSITEQLKAQRYMAINKYLNKELLIKEQMEHKEILEEIRNRQPDKAYKKMYNHIELNLKNILEQTK